MNPDDFDAEDYETVVDHHGYRVNPREEAVEFDWENLYRYDPDLAHVSLTHTGPFLDRLEEALSRFGWPREYTVRLVNLPVTKFENAGEA